MVKLDEAIKTYVATHWLSMPQDIASGLMVLGDNEAFRPNWRRLTKVLKSEIEYIYNHRTVNNVPTGYVRIYHLRQSGIAYGVQKTRQMPSDTSGWNDSVTTRIDTNIQVILDMLPNEDTTYQFPSRSPIYARLNRYFNRTTVENISSYLIILPTNHTDVARRRRTRSTPSAIPFGQYPLLAPTHAKLPYLHFKAVENTHDTNCLVSYIVSKYHLNPKKKSHAISEKNISKFFMGNTSISRLIEFVDAYKIPCKIFDVFKRSIHTTDHPADRRSQMVIMLFNNHVYEYICPNERLSRKIDFSHDATISDLPGLEMSDENKDFSESDMAFFEVMCKISPNFTIKQEVDQFPKALMLSAIPEGTQPTRLRCIDIKKAYYNSLYSTDEMNKIPVFTVNDHIMPYTRAPIVEHWYYWINNIPETKGDSIANPREAYVNNLLTGYEATWLLNEGWLNHDEITHFKASSGFILVRDVKKVFNELEHKMIQSWVAMDEDKTIKEESKSGWRQYSSLKDGFMLYNGVLGKCHTNRKYMQFEISDADDIGIIAHNNTNLTYMPIGDDDEPSMYRVRCDWKQSEYLPMNNKNIYGYIVSMCNLQLMKIASAYIRNGVKVHRMYTDDIVVGAEVPTYPEFEAITKSKNLEKITRTEGIQREVTDIEALIDEIKAHFDRVSQKIEVKTGCPGTGKTYSIRKEFDAEIQMAFTNVACRNMENVEGTADTIHSTFHMHDPNLLRKTIKKLSSKRTWIDEFSQIPNYYWSYIYCLAESGTETFKLMLSGDKNQIPPVSGEINYMSPFMQSFMNKAIVLKDSAHSRNGKDLIKLRNQIIDLDAAKLVALMKPMMDTGKIDLYTDTHICMTNKLRHMINERIIEARGLTYEGTEISEGVLLSAKVNVKSKKIYKMARYVYIGKDHNGHSIRNYEKPESEPIIVANEDITRYFELGYAITAHSAQGVTIKEKFAIHEILLMISLRKSIFYTALTRGINLTNIAFYSRGSYVATSLVPASETTDDAAMATYAVTTHWA